MVSKPGSSLKETLEQADVLSEELGSRNFISFADLNSSPYQFEFQVQLALFDDEADAKDLAKKISTLMGISTSIKQLENGDFALTSYKTENWDHIQKLYSDLSYTSYDLQPVLYLLELPG
ncbi:MAG TPA: hypothetical protein DD671_09280 [Balneolaceae bacterium]|nr:hypothetical protein [Balneolaceae bacterium]